MNARSAIVYSVLRLLAFLVPFGIMMLFPILREYYWLSAIFAALIGLSLSIVFLRRPLSEATSGLGERSRSRRKRRGFGAEDAAAEDAVAASTVDAVAEDAVSADAVAADAVVAPDAVAAPEAAPARTRPAVE